MAISRQRTTNGGKGRMLQWVLCVVGMLESRRGRARDGRLADDVLVGARPLGEGAIILILDCEHAHAEDDIGQRDGAQVKRLLPRRCGRLWLGRGALHRRLPKLHLDVRVDGVADLAQVLSDTGTQRTAAGTHTHTHTSNKRASNHSLSAPPRD